MSHQTPTPERQRECQAIARKVVGMKTLDAVQAINADDFRYRIQSIDGVGQMGTSDSRSDRINLKVANGKVVSATVG